MRFHFLILFSFFTTIIFSQEVNIVNDSISNSTENLFIENHHQQLNIKFEVSNESTNYSVPFDDEKARLKTNLNLRYALVFSYKFLSVRLGFRPPISDEEKNDKGDTKSFRLSFKLLFDKWSHHFEYNRHEGYYIANTQDFNFSNENDNFHIQFPNLTTNIFQGTTLYKFNDNYSVRAVSSQTEIQIKSAGTFMPGLEYKYYSLKDADEMKISPDEIIYRDTYNDVSGINLIANAGYYYSYVFHKYWFANAYATPGIGIDFYNSTTYTLTEPIDKSNNDVFFTFNTGISAGYNGKKIFAGAAYNYVHASEKFHDNGVQIQPSRDEFHVYIGYRFKAPKQLQKPVDYIEDKVPVLKEEDKN